MILLFLFLNKKEICINLNITAIYKSSTYCMKVDDDHENDFHFMFSQIIIYRGSYCIISWRL